MGAGAAPGMDGSGLEEGPHLAQRPLEVVVATAVDPDVAAVGGVEADGHAHGGGLPGAVRTEEAGDHPRPDLEAEPVDGQLVAEALDEAVGGDHRCALLVESVSRVVGRDGLRDGLRAGGLAGWRPGGLAGLPGPGPVVVAPGPVPDDEADDEEEQ